MTERRARSGRVVGIAEGVAAAVRRRQRDREPRVFLFRHAGDAHLVAPSAPGYDDLLDVADRMLDLAGEPAREARPWSSPETRLGPESGEERAP